MPIMRRLRELDEALLNQIRYVEKEPTTSTRTSFELRWPHRLPRSVLAVSAAITALLAVTLIDNFSFAFYDTNDTFDEVLGAISLAVAVVAGVLTWRWTSSRRRTLGIQTGRRWWSLARSFRWLHRMPRVLIAVFGSIFGCFAAAALGGFVDGVLDAPDPPDNVFAAVTLVGAAAGGVLSWRWTASKRRQRL